MVVLGVKVKGAIEHNVSLNLSNIKTLNVSFKLTHQGIISTLIGVTLELNKLSGFVHQLVKLIPILLNRSGIVGVDIGIHVLLNFLFHIVG